MGSRDVLFRRGMGLIEVLVAGTILAVVMVGFVSMFSNFSRSSKTTSETGEFEDSLNSARALLRFSEVCTCNLVSASPARTFNSGAAGATEFSYPELAPYSAGCATKGAPIFVQEVAGNPPRKLTVTSLKTKNFFRINDNNYIADFEIKAVRSGKGQIELVRKVALNFATTTVGSTVTLTACSALAPAGSGTGGMEFAQALRTDGSGDTGVDVATNRRITMLRGPRSAVIALNNVTVPLSDFWGAASTSVVDGMACNEAERWYLTGCWSAGVESDLFPYANACVTNDFDQHSSHDLVISCMRST